MTTSSATGTIGSSRTILTVAIVVMAASVGGTAALVRPHRDAATPPASAAQPAMHGHHMAMPQPATPVRALTGVALQRDRLMQQILASRAERDAHETRRGMLLLQRAQLEREFAAFGGTPAARASMRREVERLRGAAAETAAAANSASAQAAALEAKMATLGTRLPEQAAR